jgi:uncharacterized protein YjdB
MKIKTLALYLSVLLGACGGSTGGGDAPTLMAVAITPSNASLNIGTNRQFTATGTYSDGSTANVTGLVAWISYNVAAATIGGSTGLATAVAVGTTTITASVGGVAGATLLTVTSGTSTLVSIAVTPANPTIAVGGTRQFTATGGYSDGSTADITTSATWQSSLAAAATIGSATGLATGVSVGTTTITATRGTVSGNTQLTVSNSPPTLVSIAVTPPNTTASVGGTRQFTATGTYSDGSTAVITASVTWQSSNAAFATIGSTTGLATGVSAGTTTITATKGTVSGSTQLTVSSSSSALANVDLIFTNGFDLCGMKVDGSGQVVLKTGGRFDGYDTFRSMNFSGDGRFIVYEAACGGNGFIRVMGSDLGNPTNLTAPCSGKAATSPAFSPDGTKIAFIATSWAAEERGAYLYIMNSDGSSPHRITPLDGIFNPGETSPAFSSDGTRVVFTTSRGGSTFLATVSPDGSGFTTFDGGTAVTDPVPFTPTVDWVSNKIFYTSARVGVLNNEPNLYTISLTGTGKVGPLTSSSVYPLYDPSVSQDGTKVAYTQVVDFSSANILLLDLGTGLVTTISNPSFASHSEIPVFVRR